MPFNKEIKKVLVIGSGPIVIGQAAEFDYAGTQACLALKEEGIEVVLLNSNPATIMTDETIADRIYIEPMTIETIEEIIKKEKPQGIIGTLGGQTGLNLTVQLYEKHILEKYQVKLLGTPVDSIRKAEDRDQFKRLMEEIKEPIPQSKIIHTMDEGMEFAKVSGYPLIIRPAYTLGGAGGGFAANDLELEKVLHKGLKVSPIHQVLIEKSIKGWKEVEYEVIRDANDTCIIVCNMENLDPVGVHTGDSIVVAPSQTLSDEQYQILRNASLKIIRALGIIGGCNIQFALDPSSNGYYVIEVNPRVSRSSALASKATGYPIARIATKCAVGYQLDEILNPVTGNTYAAFEPALDYVVMKLPRFPFDKFPEGDRKLGTQMKATGETMAIDRTFEGALNKGLRSLEMKLSGLTHSMMEGASSEKLTKHMEEATDLRLFAIAESFRNGMSLDEIYQITQIDQWFLKKLQGMIQFEMELQEFSIDTISFTLLKKAKQMNISDIHLAKLLKCKEKEVRAKRNNWNLKPIYKQVDTCAAEFEAVTPYYYSTWNGFDEVETTYRKKAIIIGSGPIRIGQGIEFDYASVHAVNALKKLGYETIVINNNPETVSTDFSVADRLYFEPITVEDILSIIEKEKPEGVFIQFGGQTAINLANDLADVGVKLFGTSIEKIDLLEDRKLFYQLLTKLNIPHIKGEMASSKIMVLEAAEKLGFPVLVRPSYVIGGQYMRIIYKKEELESYIQALGHLDERAWPLMVDPYIPGLECELDCISDGKEVFVPGIFEHIEKAGVHSGDSIAVYPPQTLTDTQINSLVEYARRICCEAGIVGSANIQYVIHQDEIYVLEVNPRASRTVPILSKVTGIPMVEYSIRVQLGQSLQFTGLTDEPSLVAVKLPAFSSNKLKDVDPVVGPEMKSTGEVLGIGSTFEEAFQKVMNKPLASNAFLFCSIAEREKNNMFPLLKQLYDQGINIIATPGTAKFLQYNGLTVTQTSKDLADLVTVLKDNPVEAAVIIPTVGGNKDKAGFHMRELSTLYDIPLFTSVDTFAAYISLLKNKNIQVKALNDYSRLLVHE
ncbi:carbamoyl-phosphate synthase (glutamine-hydrolyzing) large subunit [Margalitia sp. FSL K6-0131]|uniref:carbamoyl-phosphate synthase (glutamine-hydrolyzing) large subunit n=1 Tax=Margalitia sp. FSL K6-0131 TaxID=2954604 RepID=UPI0030F7B259